MVIFALTPLRHVSTKSSLRKPKENLEVDERLQLDKLMHTYNSYFNGKDHFPHRILYFQQRLNMVAWKLIIREILNKIIAL